MLKLKCFDGIVPVSEDIGKQSNVIKDMLESTSGSPDNEDDNEIPVADSIHSEHLTAIVRLMNSKSADKQSKILERMSLVKLLEISVVTNYLDIPLILNLLCTVIAKRVNIRNSSTINEMFTDVAKFSDHQSKAYSGKNIDLIHFPICYNFECEENQGAIKTGIIPLNKCARCGLAKYCSKRCQKEDFTEHKEVCSKIGRFCKKVDELAASLRNHNEGFGRRINYFKEVMGRFWDFPDSRDYCRALRNMAEYISELARVQQTEELYVAALETYVKLLQLNTDDNQAVRFEVPFVLLNLDRDEDAYRFVKFCEAAENSPLSKHVDWDGQWENLPSGTIYEDLFSALKDLKINIYLIDLSFLTILALIKLRIVAKHNQKKIQYTTLKENIQKLSCTNSSLLDILPVLKEHIIGDKNWIELMQKQEEHLDMYLKLIMEKNKTFLPAIVNPDPMRNQTFPKKFSNGSPEEAFICLIMSYRLFHCIPGAILKIKSLVGTNPVYDGVLQY